MLVRDVATVVDGFKKTLSFVRSKGRPVMALPARRETGANVLLAMANLKSQIDLVNREILEPLAREHDLFIRAYVDDKQPLDDYVSGTLTANLVHTCPELPAETRRQKIAAYLAARSSS